MLRNASYDWPVITAKDLRDARIRAGYTTQKALAEALGVSLRSITNWEDQEGVGVPARYEARVRELLWPGPAPLSAYDDWEILNELGRRLYSRHGEGPSVATAPNPEIVPAPNEDEQDGASGRTFGRGVQKPRQP